MRAIKRIQHAPRAMKRAARRVFYFGKARYCPICRKSARKFGEFGISPRQDARCLFCGSLERHRLVWLYFNRQTNLFDGSRKTVLHFAPETYFEARFRRIFGADYVTADLFAPNADKKWDIMNLDCPDETFDVIYCSHVLQHVPDDRKAMCEVRRVLKTGGWAILLAPTDAEKTIEDPTITEPSQRLRVYGHNDFFRRYGPDYADRLSEQGFQVSVTGARDIASAAEIVRMGLT